MSEIFSSISQFLTLGNILFLVILLVLIVVLMQFKVVTMEHLEEFAELKIKEAEKYMESAEGKAKMDWVVEKMYESLPSFGKLLFSKEKIRALAQKIFDLIKTSITD